MTTFDIDIDILPVGGEWIDSACPLCAEPRMVVFFREQGIPTNSCLLLDTVDEATSFSTGDMALGFCPACGFVSNTAFATETAEYSQRYEETQLFSGHFVRFGKALAERWVADFDLEGKTVLEIGCGKGEFLVWMVEAGAGHGVGIDPGVHPERIETEHSDRFTWIADFYDVPYAEELQADAIVCRHTLEHLPDVARVLEEVAFWDIYYEHCSYFSLGSLARLFRSSGFEVTGLHVEYDDQYLLVEARPSTVPAAGEPTTAEDDLARLWAGVHTYAEGYAATRAHWEQRFREVRDRGGRSVIWGAGSKGVAFLTNLGVGDLIDAAVDINPYKTGKFMAGTGHAILAPEQLVAAPPDLVVVMNPVYVDEIREQLEALGLRPEIDAV